MTMGWLLKLSPKAWLIIGLSGVAVTLGARWLLEHDARIRAEDAAKKDKSMDSLLIIHWKAMYDAQAARVDTVIIKTQPILLRTDHLIDSATKFIHDTVLVRAALDSAKGAVRACTELLNDCQQFRITATRTRDSLVNLISLRDVERLKVVTPPQPPRFSHGFQAGVGECYNLKQERVPCGYAGYGFQFRFP